MKSEDWSCTSPSGHKVLRTWILELELKALASHKLETAITTEPEESLCLQGCGKKPPFCNLPNGITINHRLVVEYDSTGYYKFGLMKTMQ